MVWPRLKVLWFSKDDPTGHSKKKQQLEEVGGDNIKEWTGMDFNLPAQLKLGS